MKSLCLSQSLPLLHISTACSQKPRIPFPNKTQLGFKHHSSSSNLVSESYGLFIQKSLPFAASLVLLLSAAHPASAGILSGSTGIESVPGPELPQVDFLNRINEEKQKYAENDARFKSSPILKKLLEQSKLNKQKNQQEIQDKYCIRGAEWGIGDCSAEGMSPQDRENFIAKLKQKAGYKE